MIEDPPPEGLPTPLGPQQVAARLEGRRVRLRPVFPQDYEFLAGLHVSPSALIRWRFRGTTPSPDSFLENLWRGVLAQFVIERADRDESIGLVTAYDANFRHGHAYVAILVDERFYQSGWPLEAGALLVDYLFRVFGFRKIYIESLEPNIRQFASGIGEIFHLEGRLRDHEFFDGGYWDLLQLAIYRDEWPACARRVAPYLCESRPT